jgi:PKD repeat protein
MQIIKLILSMLKIRIRILCYLLPGVTLLTSCSESAKLAEPSISFNVPEGGLKVEIGKSLPIVPNVLNGEKSSYTWEINGEIVSSEKQYTYTPSKIGNYNIQLKVSNEAGSDNKTIQISVFSNLSPYISKVFDYQYGPGQHAALIASDCKGYDFIGKPWVGTKTFTSLGGWGGYITAGFDHTIINTNGADFGVFTQPGAGSEPGVVFVMKDANKDGIPNDGDWLEVKGSEYNHPETIRDYQVTYYKPVGKGNVTWKDNKGNNGDLTPIFDSSSWWWSGYGNKTEVVFNGVKLPNAYVNTSVRIDSENWVVNSGTFTFGYAECYNNLDYNNSLKANLFDISNVVDKTGNKVHLSGIDFIKIQSGVFQIAGWLNEVSTEVSGAVDLSLIEFPAN